MAFRSTSVRGNMLTRNNENSMRPVKEVAKVTAGPTVRRVVLGDMGNKKALVQRSATNVDGLKQEFKKPVITKPVITKPVITKPVVTKPKQPVKKKVQAKSVVEEVKQVEVEVPSETTMTSICGVSQSEDMSVMEDCLPTPKHKTMAQIEEQPSPEVQEDKDILELSNAFSNQRLTVTDIDAEDGDNPQLVSEYVNDIYNYMWTIEKKHMVSRRYLDGRVIAPRMRTILVDWLVQVHTRFNLMQETLYLTVAVLDRYLQAVPETPKDELQLVGVAAMFVAGKYEEMYCTEIGDYVYITDKAYTKLQIRRMEIKMLRTLNYYISYPLPLHFLRRNSKAAQVDGTHHNLAKYLMELCLPDYNMCHYKASEIGAAALCLTMKLIGNQSEWTDTLSYYSGYTEETLMPIVCKMAQCVIRSHSSKQQSIPQKYRNSKFMKISEIPQLHDPLIRTLSEKAFTQS